MDTRVLQCPVVIRVAIQLDQSMHPKIWVQNPTSLSRQRMAHQDRAAVVITRAREHQFPHKSKRAPIPPFIFFSVSPSAGVIARFPISNVSQTHFAQPLFGRLPLSFFLTKLTIVRTFDLLFQFLTFHRPISPLRPSVQPQAFQPPPQKLTDLHM